MKLRIFALLFLVAALCALPSVAQNIPNGDDLWSTVGGGSTAVTLSAADWLALCGVTVPDTAVNFKGLSLAGMGNGDTIVTRIDSASLPSVGSSATVHIQLKTLSLVNDGSHPCSPYTLTAVQTGTQAVNTMTITRTSSGGGTFVAVVPVKATITATNGGTFVGSTVVSGTLGDTSTSTPWSYSPPVGGAIQASPWYPAVDPVTQQPVTGCRIGKKTLPAFHCYKQASCPKGGVGSALTASTGKTSAVAIARNLCAVVATPDTPVGE